MPCATPHVKEKPNREMVLFVDDELRLLNGLRRLLRVEGFDILCAPSGEEALNVLRTHPVRVVVSDHRMPGMSGLEFLQRVHEEYPETVRMMMTGHADRDMARRALQDGTVFRFFSKPCKTFDLALTIRQALSSQDAEAHAHPKPQGIPVKWQAVWDAVSEGVLVIDANRTIQMVNKGVERIWGWGSENLVGESLDLLLSWETFDLDKEPPACLLKFEYIDIEEKRVRLEGQKKDGTTFPLELCVVQHEPSSFVVVARDQTNVGQSAREPAFNDEQEQKGQRIYVETWAQAMRSILAPVNVIVGFTRLLEMRQTVDPSQLEALQHLRQAGDELLGSLRQIREFLRLESERLSLTLEDVTIGPVVSEALFFVTPLALQRDVCLVNQTHSHHHVVLRCDKEGVSRVLRNLLSDAVKYNHTLGTVWIRSELTHNQTLRLSVLDTGSGFPVSGFQALAGTGQGWDTAWGERLGLGVGLSFTRDLVELMGGKMGVMSLLGQGSSFWFELPLAKAQRDEYGELVPA